MDTWKIDNNFLAVVEGIADPLLVISREYEIVFMNKAARDMYGDCLNDSKTTYCYAVTHGHERPCDEVGEECPVRKVYETGERVTIVHKHLHAGKDYIHEITAAPMFDDMGQVAHVVEIVRDVTKSVLLKKIEASEQRFRNLITSTPRAVITFNAEGEIIDFNPGAEAMFGHNAENVLGRNFLMVVPEKLRSQYAHDLKEALSTGEYKYSGRTTETFGLNSAGEEFPINVTLSTWEDEGEQSFCAIIEDISARKKMEQMLIEKKNTLETTQKELREKHEALNKIFKHVESAKREWEQSMDCILDIVIVANENSEILRANKPVLSIVDKPFLEILGRKWNDLLIENGMEKSGEFEGVAEFFHQPTNRYFNVRVHKVSSIGSATAHAVTLHDITERKLITAELEHSNVQLESHRKNLQRALDELAILIKRVISEKEFGVYFTLPPNLKQCWKEMQCDEHDCPCYGREPLMCWQEAGTFCKGKVQGHFAEKYGDCEQCKYYQELIADPTYQIGIQFNNMMKILEDKNKELENAYAELKATQSQVLQQEKMASIGQLAAGIAHEINNPVGFITSNIGSLSKYVDKLQQFIEAQSAVIANYENFLATDELDALRKKLKIDFIMEDVKDLVRESLDGTDRVKTIVQNLKNFSRVDQSEHAMVDLNECMESTLNIVWNELKYKTTVHKEYGEIPLTFCYPQQLNQVFMNLLVNAAQAIKEQGEITIKTWSEDDTIYVSVSDTGSGIPEENLNKLFEPFFTTKEVGKGTGLGLSIAYDIVTKKHEGELLVESEVGKGTTFTVKIPVVVEKEIDKGAS